MMFENPPGIIPSLDVDIERAKEVLECICELRKEIAAIKIGSILCWEVGLKNAVSELKKICNFPIIFDAQKAGTDIPEIVRKQVEIAAKSGVDAFIAAPQGSGSATLAAFVEACFEHKITPIVVVEMTHPECNSFLSKDASDKILEKSIELGVVNFVAPANKPERLKIYKDIALGKKKEIRILSPGIGPQGGGPDSAVKSGSDFIIIGRSIYQAIDPKKRVIQIYTLIKDAYSARENSI